MIASPRAILDHVRRLRIARPRDLARRGIPPAGIARLVSEGRLDRVGRGLYTLHDADLGEKRSLLLVAARAPASIFCLLTALRIHDLTTQNPVEVWITIPHKARPPVPSGLPLRIVRASPRLLGAGVVEQRIHGVPIRVYCPAKTVADCFKFRSLVGQDVAAEALRDCWRRRKAGMDDLWRYARLLRVTRSMRPYLEALV